MTPLTTEDFACSIEAEYAVVLFVATWANTSDVRSRMEDAERAFSPRVRFFEVDADAVPQFVNQLGIQSVPSIAYYRAGKLLGVVVGAYQDISAETATLIDGESSWLARRQRLA